MKYGRWRKVFAQNSTNKKFYFLMYFTNATPTPLPCQNACGFVTPMQPPSPTLSNRISQPPPPYLVQSNFVLRGTPTPLPCRIECSFRGSIFVLGFRVRAACGWGGCWGMWGRGLGGYGCLIQGILRMWGSGEVGKWGAGGCVGALPIFTESFQF